MYHSDLKGTDRIAPHIQRVMIVDPMPASAQLLSDLLRNVTACRIWTVTGGRKALQAAQLVDPMIVFTEYSGPELNGLEFARAFRKSDMACRKAPIVMITGEATAAAILGARDAGVHEFLRKPYTVKDLIRRLEAVTLQHRDWVEAVGYIGPDRRRFNSGEYQGPGKRRSDAGKTGKAKIAEGVLQAVKIVDAAMLAIGSDPAQALRSMRAQAEDLQKAAVKAADMSLMNAAVEFRKYLSQAQVSGLDAASVQAHADRLWACLPAEAAAERARAA